MEDLIKRKFLALLHKINNICNTVLHGQWVSHLSEHQKLLAIVKHRFEIFIPGMLIQEHRLGPE